jgi:hypothetical protein
MSENKIPALVAQAIIDFAKMTGNSVFIEYTGFKSKKPMDIAKLKMFVFEKTGYGIDQHGNFVKVRK